MADSCLIPDGLSIAALAVAGFFLVAFTTFVINSRLGCLPAYLSRFMSDKNFAREYDNRLDHIIMHELKKKFKFGKKLGEGVTSEVYRVVERSSDKTYALKRIPLKNASLKRVVKRELQILKTLRHKNVTYLHDECSSPRHCWVVLEYVSGGELTHFITTTDDCVWGEPEAARCTYQVLAGLAYLHSHGVIHRDIKLANLLRSTRSAHDFTMKIADFGAATVMEVPHDINSSPSAARQLADFKALAAGKDAIGTPCNMAPEVFQRCYGPMCDMWSLGCVVYELVTGQPPFDPYKLPADDPEYWLKKNVKAARYPRTELESWNELSPEATAFVQSLLTVDPTVRLSSWEALDAPWMGKRYRDHNSDRSTLGSARKTMVERRQSMSKPPPATPASPDGAAKPDGASSGDGAGGGTPLHAPLPQAMMPMREASGLATAHAREVSVKPSETMNPRNTGIATVYGDDEGWGDEVEIEVGPAEVQVEVREEK